MNSGKLAGKTALVTGGNHGIGAAIAKAIGAQGANVFVTYFRPETWCSERELREAVSAGIGGSALYQANQQRTPDHVVSSIAAAGGSASMMELDLSPSESASAAMDACEAEFGRVEILVNNHAYCSLETFDPASVGGGRLRRKRGPDIRGRDRPALCRKRQGHHTPDGRVREAARRKWCHVGPDRQHKH